jgi:RNA polymerase sigma-70 factor (ECF subfamily)
VSAGELSNWAELTDAQLIELAAAGAEKALAQLLSRYRQRILMIGLRMLNDKIEAEEATQDIFVKIFLHLKDFDPGRDFGIWCTAIAVNECRDRLRKRQRSMRTFRELSEADRIEVVVESGDCHDEKERLSIVEKAIENLPEKLKEVVVLKAYGGHSYEEIAKILKIRMGTVMSRLFRARQRLTEMIERGDAV